VNEAVDRLMAERAHLDAGLPGPLMASVAGHVLVASLAVLLPLLLPRQPPLQVADGFAVVLPRGGGGTPAPAPSAPPATAPPAPKAETAPAPPPKVVKPPKAEPRPLALPLPNSHRRAPKVETPPPLPAAAEAPGAKAASASPATPGLEVGPAGPGVPQGTDSAGDWYLAGVQQKIWSIWSQQLKAGFSQPIGVTFTILVDGQVADVRVTQPSGVALLDLAAQRAILNAAPFGPLPREYGGKPKTIQAIFKPAS
jgi:TonB family protein